MLTTKQREVLDIIVRKAHYSDIDQLVELHMLSFNKDTHLPVKFGRSYIRAMYRWFLNSPTTFIFIAESKGRIAGLIASCDESYNRPMFRNTISHIIIAALKRPWLLLNSELMGRFKGILTKRRIVGEMSKGEVGVAYLAFSAIDPAYRGVGIGDKLYKYAIIECVQRGCKKVRGGVRPKNNTGPTKILSRYGFHAVVELETDDTIFYEADSKVIKGVMGL